jgi:hypothetical protein
VYVIKKSGDGFTSLITSFINKTFDWHLEAKILFEECQRRLTYASNFKNCATSYCGKGVKSIPLAWEGRWLCGLVDFL